MVPRSFYFLRHGETDWNKVGRLQGQTDIPLNDTGREQARLAAPILKKYAIDRIIASPLSRALETAQIINEVLQKPLIADERLCEKNFGVYEGKTGPEIDAWKEAWLKEDPTRSFIIEPESGHTRPVGGESHEELRDRVFALKKEVMTQYADENILFVAHGGVYQMLCGSLLKEIIRSPNAKPFQFVRNAPLEWSLIHLE